MKKILSILFLLPSLLFGQSYIDQYGTLMNPGFDNKSVTLDASEEANGNGTITVTSPGAILYSQVIQQSSILNIDLELDFLSVFGTTIDGVSDQLILCGTPISATITTFPSLNIKEY